MKLSIANFFPFYSMSPQISFLVYLFLTRIFIMEYWDRFVIQACILLHCDCWFSLFCFSRFPILSLKRIFLQWSLFDMEWNEIYFFSFSNNYDALLSHSNIVVHSNSCDVLRVATKYQKFLLLCARLKMASEGSRWPIYNFSVKQP